MKLSIVATLYRSAAYVREFRRRAGEQARRFAGEDYEIVLVNDGSPDDSLALALAEHAADPHVVVVDLSRNFGHHRAMMIGLAHARGEHVFLIDADLEEEPEWLASFAAQMHSDACDVVYGVQRSRKGDWFERFSGWLFYRLFDLIGGVRLPANMTTARLMTRRYVDALLAHREREVFIVGLWLITGFEQRAQTVVKHGGSPSTYTLRRKLTMAIDSITSFSNMPLVAIFYLGLAISLAAGLYMSWLVVQWTFLARPLLGWTSLMASIWLLGGLIILFIGVVGIYLSRIYSETKQRPYGTVRQLHRREP